jgi:hypothetical protein
MSPRVRRVLRIVLGIVGALALVVIGFGYATFGG